MLGADFAIGKEEESRAPAAAQRGSGKLSKTAARSRDSTCRRKSEIDFLDGAKDGAEMGQLGGGDDRAWERDAIFQVNVEGHDVGFAQGIDGRVGDLGEALLAVVPESSWEGGEKGGRGVVAHAPVGFFALEERGEKSFELVVGPTGGGGDALGIFDDGRRRGSGRRGGEFALWDGVVRLADGEAFEDVAPAQEKAGGGIGENHFAGAEALALGDARFIEIDEAGFGAGDEQAVMREGVAHGAEAVAVELGADKFAVGKDEGGGAVPGLVLLRESGEGAADIAREQGIFFEGGRNHGEHGFFRGEAFEELQFETVVEAGGIADVFFEDGEPGADGEPGTDFALFGAEPAAVGDDGIDFAVVGDVAEGLREMPGGLRVGGIALMKDGEGRFERGIAQVFVKLGELPGREEAFVDDGLGRKRAEVGAGRQERFGAFAEEGEAPFEAGRSAPRMERLDEELPDFRHGFEGAAAERIGIHGNAAPAENAEALGVGGGFDGGASFLGFGGEEKREANGEDFGQLDALLLRARAEEGLGERSEQAGAVAAGAIGVDSTAVGEALEGGQSMLDDLVAGGAAEAGDEAGAAGVVVRVAPVGMAGRDRAWVGILFYAQPSTMRINHI